MWALLCAVTAAAQITPSARTVYKNRGPLVPYKFVVSLSDAGSCTFSSATDSNAEFAAGMIETVYQSGTKILVDWRLQLNTWSLTAIPDIPYVQNITITFDGGCAAAILPVTMIVRTPHPPGTATYLKSPPVECTVAAQAPAGTTAAGVCISTEELYAAGEKTRKPALFGGTYVDPLFGSKHVTLAPKGEQHSYSARTPWSATGQYLHTYSNGVHNVYRASDGTKWASGLPTAGSMSPFADDEYFYFNARQLRHVRFRAGSGQRTDTLLLDMGIAPYNWTTNLRDGGTGDIPSDGWWAFLSTDAPNQACVLKVAGVTAANVASIDWHSRLYCGSWAGYGQTSLDSVHVTNRDSTTGKTYVIVLSNAGSPTRALIYSINETARTLDFEFDGPEYPDTPNSTAFNGDGIVQAGEEVWAFTGQHSDVVSAADGRQFIVLQMGLGISLGRWIVAAHIAKGRDMFVHESCGGGLKMLYPTQFPPATLLDAHFSGTNHGVVGITHENVPVPAGFQIAEIGSTAPARIGLLRTQLTAVNASAGTLHMAVQPGCTNVGDYCLAAGVAVRLETTGTLPAPLVAGSTYYVESSGGAGTSLCGATPCVTLATARGGSRIVLSDGGSGTHHLVQLHGLSTGTVIVAGTYGPSVQFRCMEGAWAVTVVNDREFTLNGSDCTAEPAAYNNKAAYYVQGARNYSPFRGMLVAANPETGEVRHLAHHRTFRTTLNVYTGYQGLAFGALSRDGKAFAYRAGFGIPYGNSTGYVETEMRLPEQPRVTSVVSAAANAALFRYTSPAPCGLSVSADRELAGVTAIDLPAKDFGERLLAGLLPETQYFYRLVCGNHTPAVEIRNGQFRTTGNPQDPVRLTVEATGIWRAARLVVDYGSTPAVTDGSASIACSEGNVCSVTAETAGGLVYLRQRQVDADGTTLSETAVQPVTI